jgi:hypothetical protein
VGFLPGSAEETPTHVFSGDAFRRDANCFRTTSLEIWRGLPLRSDRPGCLLFSSSAISRSVRPDSCSSLASSDSQLLRGAPAIAGSPKTAFCAPCLLRCFRYSFRCLRQRFSSTSYSSVALLSASIPPGRDRARRISTESCFPFRTDRIHGSCRARNLSHSSIRHLRRGIRTLCRRQAGPERLLFAASS